MKTPDDAKTDWVCPSSWASEGDNVWACVGPKCAAWRWEKITTAHPLWMPAVKARAEEIVEKPPYAKSAAWVAANKETLGMVPKVGYCGLGGQP